MKHPNSQHLYECWNRARGEHPAPLRSELTPRHLKAVLPNMFIVERHGARSYPFRLAGTALCRMFARELSGENFLRPWSPAERECLDSLLYTVSEDLAGAVLGARGYSVDGREHALECLILPALADSDRRVQVMGVFSLAGGHKALDRSPLLTVRLASLRLIWPGRMPHFIDLDGSIGIDEFADAAPPPPRSRRRGNFWVIDGGADG